MQDTVQKFVEQMGLMCEEDGMPRSSGRILGFLLAEDGPFSLDELAEQLQMSKASVADALPPENANGCRRLREASRFHLLLLEASQRLVEMWRERRDADAVAGETGASK
jgi:biotin operon repressor